MLLGKKRKLGRMIEEFSVGEKLTLTERMEDKDLLLYLGLTNDANPLYIQHDYASQTPYKKPIVPSLMLTGIITSAISKYLPGPGSCILRHELDFWIPVYHYETIQFLFELTDINLGNNRIEITVTAENEKEEEVLKGKFLVSPPVPIQANTVESLDNF